jgi:C4-dicarboxylate transporter DctM subunit
MEWGVAGLAIVGAVVAAVLMGLPIGVSLGLVSFVFIWSIGGLTTALTVVSAEFFDFWSSYTMLSMLLFIIMGEFMIVGGVMDDLFDFSSKWLQRIPGGLAMVAIGAGALFGTLSGSGIAGITTIGLMAAPQMVKKGYNKSLIAGCVMASGSMAHLIPPSVLGVLYASLVEISIGRQLMAGLIPGVLLSFIFAALIFVWVTIYPDHVPAEPPVSWSEKLKAGRRLWLPLSIGLIVLGAIYSGITTATEAAGLGAFIAIVVALGKKISFEVFLKTAMKTVQTTSFIMLIAVGGKLLSWCVTYYQIPQHIVTALTTLEANRWVVMVMLQILYFVLGMFIDPISIVVVTVPILVPVLGALHFDLMWFGILLLINLEVALITPPLGFGLYIVQDIMRDTATFGQILKGGLLFCIGALVCIAILMAFPILVTWLPDKMLGM